MTWTPRGPQFTPMRLAEPFALEGTAADTMYLLPCIHCRRMLTVEYVDYQVGRAVVCRPCKVEEKTN